MKKLCLVLGLTLTASLLAACGGSSDSSDSTSSAASGEMSKSEWIAQADDVCREYKDETKDLTAEFESLQITSKSTPEELTQAAEMLRQIDAKSEDETDALRELEPPSADQATIDTMLSKVEQTREIGLQAADALEKGDESKLEGIVGKGNAINDEAKEMADEFGMKVCGSEG